MSGIDEDRKLPKTFYHTQIHNGIIKGDVRNGGADGTRTRDLMRDRHAF